MGTFPQLIPYGCFRGAAEGELTVLSCREEMLLVYLCTSIQKKREWAVVPGGCDSSIKCDAGFSTILTSLDLSFSAAKKAKTPLTLISKKYLKKRCLLQCRDKTIYCLTSQKKWCILNAGWAILRN